MSRSQRPLQSASADWDPKYAYLVRTRTYLASLSDGIDSFPECCVKGGVWRNIVAGTDMERLAQQVPAELGILPDNGILASSWFPATQHFAAHLAMRDCLFDSDDAIYLHFRELNRKLLSGRLYRVMFAVASPQMIAHASSRRFSAMFRGVHLKARQLDSQRMRVQLDYPEGLVPRLVARLYMTAFEAALELAGARGIAGRMLTNDSTQAVYEMVWD